MTLAGRPTAVEGERLQALFDALLYSVSHDLRSPLLTISLSAELITNHLAKVPEGAEESGASVAIGAMQHGAADLERMLQAITQLSRARRRTLDGAGARLQVLLGGHIVLSDVPELGARVARVDPLVVRELLDALAGDAPAEVRAALEGSHVVLRIAAPEAAAGVEGSPLEALVASLQAHAGTVIESLAVSELLLSRQGGALALSEGQVLAWLPLSNGGAGV